ncbi:MAG: zinc ABC transporter substrate-binding protein [Marinospirillum sp.]|uniref:metal ABC transporter solute-binding protein, Zn/Mn family n=1 Tax=Marinospirillum sp. TaxID=2183934 RepID=UPI0019FACD89|nr:zinc ABC transporter substrate-binding protein [Marinospirillum sp.]MBE0506427.1 zinc ABC transporter substrate-binding protein [Marinospirillum sp.]
MQVYNKLRGLLALSLALPCLLLPSLAVADKPVKVVATFSILGDMIREIGGDRVEVMTLVGANEDVHVYQPRPSDSRTLMQADLVVENGLDLKGWMNRLVEASGYRGLRVTASEGISRIRLDEDKHDHKHDHKKDHQHAHAGQDYGEYDPHAWQGLEQAQVYVHNIRDGLIKADPAGKAYYQARAAAYTAEIQALHSRMSDRFNALSADRKTVMSPHDAFGYLAKAYGLTLVAPQGISTASEPSAAEMAALVRQIRQQKVAALFMENIGDTRLVDQLKRETGVVLGGTLYSDALSDDKGPAASYLKMMEHNLETLLTALEQ